MNSFSHADRPAAAPIFGNLRVKPNTVIRHTQNDLRTRPKHSNLNSSRFGVFRCCGDFPRLREYAQVNRIGNLQRMEVNLNVALFQDFLTARVARLQFHDDPVLQNEVDAKLARYSIKVRGLPPHCINPLIPFGRLPSDWMLRCCYSIVSMATCWLISSCNSRVIRDRSCFCALIKRPLSIGNRFLR